MNSIPSTEVLPLVPSKRMSSTSKRFWHFSVIFLISLLTFGVYFSYDLPAAIPDDYRAHFRLSYSQYELLYTFYSVPSVIMPFFGGAIADQWLGPHTVATMTCIISAVGCGLVVVACYSSSFMLALLGRLMLGVGGEATFSLQQVLCAVWFEDDLRPLAMGTAITLGSLGEVLNFVLTAPLRARIGFNGANAWAVLPCLISVVAALVLSALHAQHQKVARQITGDSENQGHDEDTLNISSSNGFVDGCDGAPSASHQPLEKSNYDKLAAVAATEPASSYTQTPDEIRQNLLLVSDIVSLSESFLQENGRSQDASSQDDDRDSSWRQIVSAEPMLLYSINFLYAAPYYLFPSMCKLLLSSQSSRSSDDVNRDDGISAAVERRATAVLVTFYGLPILASPFVGVSVAGKTPEFLRWALTSATACFAAGFFLTTFAGSLFSAAHGGWVLVVDVALSGLVALSFTVASTTLTPCLALAVPGPQRGKAFGLWSSSQAAGVSALSVAVGSLADSHGPEASVALMGVSAAASALLALLLALKYKE